MGSGGNLELILKTCSKTACLLLAAAMVLAIRAKALPLSGSKAILTMPETLPIQPDPTEIRQFIGSSVLGGLMWPVLLTLALTAMMARVPDFFQRILGGSGGRSFPYDPRFNLLSGPENSRLWEEKLEETLRIFQRATNTFDEGSP